VVNGWIVVWVEFLHEGEAPNCPDALYLTRYSRKNSFRFCLVWFDGWPDHTSAPSPRGRPNASRRFRLRIGFASRPSASGDFIEAANLQQLFCFLGKLPEIVSVR
jgi:hypothetical protein